MFTIFPKYSNKVTKEYWIRLEDFESALLAGGDGLAPVEAKIGIVRRPVESLAGNHVLSVRFYDRETETVARELLGKELRVRQDGRWCSGAIVETEAYLRDDPASHSYRGPSLRNRSMFKGPGTVYVYSLHRVDCVNVVTRRGEAVLIRALQPLANVTMSTKGPGRLCRALHIIREKHDGLVFTGPEIQILPHKLEPFEISASKRIGISKATQRLLRFFVKDNPFVSR